MRRLVIYVIMGVFLMSGLVACKAKHCAALDDTMEGYDARKVKKRRGRQEGLFDKRRMR